MGNHVFSWLSEGEQAPLRWYHFAAPAALAAFIVFCILYTLWRLA